MIADIDVIVVYHRNENEKQARALEQQVRQYESEERVRFLFGDNRHHNIGFGARCNLVAFEDVLAPVVGFLNPDVNVTGPFSELVTDTLTDKIVVTGERFGKPSRDLQIWGVRDWVCGAAMFVDRVWFDRLNGFDPAYVWSWEETDFIRRTFDAGKRVKSIHLPIAHPPAGETFDPKDAAYKRKWFARGAADYRRRYGIADQLVSPRER
jgi:GT2 family glycosyltransferase